MKKYIFILVALLVIASKAFSEGKLEVLPATVSPGSTATMSLALTNPNDKYTALQVDLYMPEGIELEKKNGEYKVELSRVKESHSVNISQMNGFYRLILFSMKNEELTGTSGKVITLSIKMGESITTGAKQGSMKNIKLVKDDNSGVIIDNKAFTIDVIAGSVSLDKAEAILKKGSTLTLKATVLPETLTDKSVTWKSSNESVATVSSSGKVKGVKSGMATITCTSVATGMSATCEVLVGFVKLDKTEAILEKTKTLTLTATVYPSKLEDKSVTWKSSNTAVATVSSKGKITGVKAGTTTITCTSKATGLSTTCKVTVGYVQFEESEYVVEKGKAMTLEAKVYPSALEDKSVTWKSSNTKVATVTSDGKVKGIKAGTANITCTSNATGLSTTCKVIVSYVKFEESEYVVEKGKTMTLKAMVYPSTLENKSVTWKSSNESVATVSTSGKVKGIKAGKATITCTSVATGVSTTCQVLVGYIKLDQTELVVEKTKTATLTATVYPSSLTDKSVTWKSSNTSVAMVSSSGKVKGVNAGTATITCTSNATGLKTTCNVIVSYVKLDRTEAIIQKGKTMTLKVTVYPSSLEDKSVTWKSSNESVATVTSKGKVKGIKAGKATITCTSVATGVSTTCKVTVGYVVLDKEEVTVKKGKTVTLTPTVYPSSLTDKSVTWESSNTAVATVSSAGKVKGVKAGMAIITCTSNATGLSAMCIVTVIATSSSRSLDGDDDDNTTGIEDIETINEAVNIEPFDVYDLRGQRVRHQVTSLDGLPDGIYIVNGKKILKK